MAEKLKWNGGALLAPLPAVLVSCGNDEKANVFTVAWTGITNTIPPKTYISVRPSRYSYELIKESGEFIINLPTTAIVKQLDFCGIHTGRKVDKFKKCNLTKETAFSVSCPAVAECPMHIECRVTDVIPLGSHDMFIADIVSCGVNSDLVDKSGKLHLENAGLLAFAHGEYFALGKRIGSFGFSVRKKSNGKPSQKDKKKSQSK